MNGIARTLLIEPLEELREALGGLLRGSPQVQLVEAIGAFDGTVDRVERQRPTLVVLGLDSDITSGLELLRKLATAYPHLAVLPASCTQDSAVILAAMRAGAREFLALPTTASDLNEAIGRLAATLPAVPPSEHERPSREIAVLGAAGGLGTTMLAVNLATTFAAIEGTEAAVIDLDLLLGAVDVTLDIVPSQTIADLARNVDRLDAELLKRSLTRHASGVYVLPAPVTMDDAMHLDPDALVRTLDLIGRLFPVVVFDLSKQLNQADCRALERAHAVVLVVRPEPACLRNACRLLELFRQEEGFCGKVYIVASRIGALPFEVSLKKAEQVLDLPIRWQIPEAPKIFGAARSRGVPLSEDAPGSRPHRVVVELAHALFPETVLTTRKGTRFGRLAASLF
jgi:pilus assembly protein CpaE